MKTKDNNISNAFHALITDAPAHAQAWMEAVKKLDAAGALDAKTGEIAYIAVLAAVGLEGGIPFHVQRARELGAGREEIISAVLLGLPAAGNRPRTLATNGTAAPA